MINRSYDKLNYNLFMLDSSFEYYSRGKRVFDESGNLIEYCGKGQIEIDDNGNLIFVHYIKEDSKNLYWDEEPRELFFGSMCRYGI